MPTVRLSNAAFENLCALRRNREEWARGARSFSLSSTLERVLELAALAMSPALTEDEERELTEDALR